MIRLLPSVLLDDRERLCQGSLKSTTICRQMTTDSSHSGIESLFASRSIARLLAAFTAQPGRRFYQRELQRATGAHLRQLQRDLARLQQAGLIERQAEGNRVYYRAVTDHPAFPEMRALMAKTIGLGDVLRESLETVGHVVQFAFVYGSVARGDEVASSDVDLFVVGSVTRKDLAAALAPAAETLGRELNPVILRAEEFAARRRAHDHFIEAVLSGPRLWLVGDDDKFVALA